VTVADPGATEVRHDRGVRWRSWLRAARSKPAPGPRFPHRLSPRSHSPLTPSGKSPSLPRASARTTHHWVQPSAFDPFRACRPTNLPRQRVSSRHRQALRARTRSSVRRNQRTGSSLTAATVETSIQTMFSASVLTEASAVQTTATQPPGLQPVRGTTTRQWGKPSVFDPLPAHRPPILPHQRAARPHRPALRTRTRSSVRRNPQSGSSLTAVTVKTSIQTMFSAPVPI